MHEKKMEIKEGCQNITQCSKNIHEHLEGIILVRSIKQMESSLFTTSEGTKLSINHINFNTKLLTQQLASVP